MNFRPFDFLARPLAIAGGLAIAALATFSPPSVAQTDPGAGKVSLSTGANCTYTSITTFPTGGVAVTCSGAATTSATISIGTVTGSLNAGAASTANVPVSCSGTACNGVEVGVAITPAVTGLSLLTTTPYTFPGAGSRTFVIDGTPPASGTASATVVVTLTNKGTATTTDPANVGDTKSVIIPIASASDPGTLAFSPTSATITEGGAIQTVNVTRTGSGTAAPTVTVNYTCTALPSGYAPAITPAASGTLTWTNADATAKPITINPITVPGSTAGSVTCTLSSPSGGATASTTSYVLTVNKASSGGGACTTTADTTVDFSAGTLYRASFLMNSSKTGAVKFKPTRGLVQSDGSIITQNNVKLNYSAPIPGTNAAAYYQINISECPGDFTTSLGPNCGPLKTSGTARTTYASVLDVTSTNYCEKLDPAKTYYYNLRFLKSDNSAGCNYSTCGAYVDMTPF